MLKKIAIFISALSFLVFGSQLVSASSQDKADQFYNSLPKDEYKEYSDASVKVREYIPYKDVQKFASKLGEDYVTQKKVGSNQSIDPNHQVYFYASLVDNDKMTLKKYAIYDATTKERINAGFSQQAKREAVDNGTFAGWDKSTGTSELSNSRN